MPTRNSLLKRFESALAGAPLDPRAMAAGMGTASSEGAARIGANFLPFVGDAVGLMQDAEMYLRDPSSRTPGNAMLTGLGALPFIPGMTAYKEPAREAIKVFRAQRKGRKTVGRWWTTDRNVAEEFQAIWGGPEKVEVLEMDLPADDVDAFIEAALDADKSAANERALLLPKGWKR